MFDVFPHSFVYFDEMKSQSREEEKKSREEKPQNHTWDSFNILYAPRKLNEKQQKLCTHTYLILFDVEKQTNAENG